MDFINPPYDHTWNSVYPSIFNPGSKIIFPELIMEMVIFWRTKLIKTYPNIVKGPGWSLIVSKDVRGLMQQANVILNFFENPVSEPLVEVAFKNFFRQNRVLKIGHIRKTRITKDGKLNITQDEMDILKGVEYELNRLKKQRDIFKDSVKITSEEPKKIKNVKVQSSKKIPNKLNTLLSLEKQILDSQPNKTI